MFCLYSFQCPDPGRAGGSPLRIRSAQAAGRSPNHPRNSTLASVQRQSPTSESVAVGDGVGCAGSFSSWKRTATGVEIIQDWPGGDTCPTGPVWLPLKACSSTRRYDFTEVGTCQLRCVRIAPASGEVICKC